ncbi:mechanosensitive ion channel [Thermosynechococcus sp. PP22]|uniref:mechanosensitive ion channel n=1 Tax=Thermosynechococcus sp. PP22 TaxID=3074082 RepID=UPI0028737C79|nr:mechanosensitive ion channel [Thermosynechococcus sp. PP22]WNC22525.1 mechanosensitive ion channel [Thermosynechococcus sp. PP22]
MRDTFNLAILRFSSKNPIEGLLAQVNTEETSQVVGENSVNPAFDLNNLGSLLAQVIIAVALLLIGWIVATILAKITRSVLKRMRVDERLTQFFGGNESLQSISVTAILAAVVFWVILLLAVVAFLDALRLTTVSQPLNAFLNQVFSFLPKLGAAILLADVAWVVATISKMVVTQSARSLNLDRQLPLESEGNGSSEGPATMSVAEMLGNTLYWFVFLFFLPLILGVLDLQGSLQPVQNLLNDILGALPFVFKAVIIAVVGWFIARIVRSLVINLMTAMGIQRIGQRLGLGQTSLGESLATVIGTIVYVLILIPTAIASLDALQIVAITEPATAMLNQVLTALPKIFTAAIILLLAYVIGRFVAETVTNFLQTIGFDQVLVWLGLERPMVDSQESQPAEAPEQRWRQPSEVMGIVAFVGVLLFGAIAAVDVLDIPALSAFVTALVVVIGRVLVGTLILAVGLYFANLVFRLVASSGTSQGRFLAQAARLATMTFVGAMALQQMGIATSIVNLAFGLLFGSIAVAIALAFGLGCRQIAAAQVEEWLNLLKGRNSENN